MCARPLARCQARPAKRWWAARDLFSILSPPFVFLLSLSLSTSEVFSLSEHLFAASYFPHIYHLGYCLCCQVLGLDLFGHAGALYTRLVATLFPRFVWKLPSSVLILISYIELRFLQYLEKQPAFCIYFHETFSTHLFVVILSLQSFPREVSLEIPLFLRIFVLYPALCSVGGMFLLISHSQSVRYFRLAL